MYSGYNRAEVRMRVLIADKLPDLSESRLVESGCQVRVDAAAKEQSLLDAITSFDPEVLVVRSTRVDKAHITAGSRLGLVVRAGAGVRRSPRRDECPDSAPGAAAIQHDGLCGHSWCAAHAPAARAGLKPTASR